MAFESALVVFERVAIVGIGLIGGSFAAALRRAGAARHLVGHARTDGARALAAGLIDELAADPAEAVRGADLVVLAAPVSVNAALFPALAPVIAPGALITDLSSVKADVAEAAVASLGPRLAGYVPTHPIAGGERKGPDNADAALFDGRLVILSPLPSSDPAAIERFDTLWRCLGAYTRRLDVATHDAVYAAVSHWPHVAAYALAAAIAARLPADGDVFVGPGLRDLTRIAASDPALWADIVLANADHVLACADGFEQELARIRGAIAAGDRDRLVEAFSLGANWRRGLAGR